MFLIRHNRLLPPYHDYAALTVQQLDDLATGAVSPPIAPIPDPLPWPQAIQDKLRAAPFFVTSPSLRAQQTARAVMAALGIDKPLSVDDNLREIDFVPSVLMKSQDENPLQAVRDRLYAAILNGQAGAEPFETLRARMDMIRAEYASSQGVLFTHGFLVRLYQSYQACRYDIKMACEYTSSVPSVNYLQILEF